MRINSITTTGVASAVWANATRTLTNPSGVWSDATRQLTNPSGVFSDASRSLTNLGSTMVTVISVAQTSLAASTNVDLASAAGHFRRHSVGTSAAAVGQMQVGLYDGTNFFFGEQTPNGGGATHSEYVSTATTRCLIKNTDGASAHLYMHSGVDWAI